MNTRFRQAGLSLIELMISITLGLIILSGVLVVFVNTSTARNEVERTSRQIENGRYASELLSEDIRLAGFYGELNVGQVGAPTALPDNPCSLDPTDWKKWVPVHIQGYDDPGATPPFAETNCALTNRVTGTDVLVIRRARACVAGSTSCDTATNSKPYVQVALCADQAASVTTAYKLGIQGGTEPFDRQKKDCTAGNPADKRQYLVHIYFVASDNGQGQTIPTLKRLELTGDGTNPKWDLVPLVEGIEQFQLHYGLDNDGDGVPDVYVADPNDHPVGACTGTCPLNNWMKIVTVQFHVLARNLETSPNYTETKTYHMGLKKDGTAFDVVSPTGAYRRHIYSGLVRMPNPAGRKDTP